MPWFRRKSFDPDYAKIDSRAKAQALAEQGKLVRLLLLPEQFGGDDRDENVVFVPPFVAELKCETDQNIILPLAMDGKITKYSAEPKYSGRSFVPTAIELVAHSPGNFSHRIAIWGEGLER